MSRFLKLLRKDLESSKLSLFFFSGIIVAIFLFVRIKFLNPGILLPEEIIPIAIAIPLVFMPLWLFWQTINILRIEWKEDTIYTLMVLPIPGWRVLLSKLITILIEYSVLLLATALGGLLVFKPWLLEPLQAFGISLSWLLRNGFLVYLLSLFALGSLVVFLHLAFIVAKMVGRFQGLIMIQVLVLTQWIVSRLISLLEPLTRWLPRVPVHRLFRFDQIGKDYVQIEMAIGSYLIWGFCLLALFGLTHYLFENYLEVNE